MAVDARNKRASVIGLASAALLVLPAPGTPIQGAERAHLAYSYAAANFEPPIIAAEGGGWYEAPRKKREKPRRKQIEEVVRAAAIQRIDEQPVELIDPNDILALLQESKPILDARLFLPDEDRVRDEQDIEDAIKALIEAGLL